MINLKNITLLSIDCVNAIESARAMKYSSKGINFRESILITDEDVNYEGIKTIRINKLTSWTEYNDFVLRLNEYIDTDYVLLIQSDGYVINSDIWTNDFLKYDFIGAPWPSEQSWIDIQVAKDSMNKTFNSNRVGNGGFSLRSRKFLEASAKYNSCEGYGEDIFLASVKYNELYNQGIRFAPYKLAYKFSYESPLIEYGNSWRRRIELDVSNHFGFHGKNFVNSQELIDLKNEIEL